MFCNWSRNYTIINKVIDPSKYVNPLKFEQPYRILLRHHALTR